MSTLCYIDNIETDEKRMTRMNKLYPFQQTGCEFLASRKSALLADEMGLGKTPQTIAAINQLRAKKVLILCPASLRINWKRELEKWLSSPRKIFPVFQSNTTIPEDADIVIASYDVLTYGGKYDGNEFKGSTIFDQLITRTFAVLVCDEAHYLKNRDALRTKITLMRNQIASRCVHKWYLTGTPVLNRPSELFPILRSSAPEVIKPFTSYTAYTRYFCGGYFDGLQWWDKGATHCEELHERLTRDFMLRRTKQEVLNELPEKTFQVVSVPQTEETKKLVAEEFKWDEQTYRNPKIGAMEVGDLATHRQLLALRKVNQAISWIQEVLVSEDKVVVFAHHREVIRLLGEGLANYNPVTLTGATSHADRQLAVDDFQTDPVVRVFIGQTQAAGIGLTLTAGSHVVFVEPEWTPGVIHQAVDRCHRIGQKSAVLAQFLVVENSLEEKIMYTVVEKTKTIRKIVEGE